VTSIGGGLLIYENTAFTNLTGLDNLASIGGRLHIDANASLTTLSGLANVAFPFAHLRIRDNPQLSICEIKCVCDHLDGPPYNNIIGGNGPGCNTLQEVEDACMSVGVSDLNSGIEVLIYPNPTNTIVTISSPEEIAIDQVNVYNQIGQMVLHQQGSDKTVDVGALSPGLYIVEIVSDRGISSSKLKVE